MSTAVGFKAKGRPVARQLRPTPQLPGGRKEGTSWNWGSSSKEAASALCQGRTTGLQSSVTHTKGALDSRLSLRGGGGSSEGSILDHAVANQLLLRCHIRRAKKQTPSLPVPTPQPPATGIRRHDTTATEGRLGGSIQSSRY